MRLSLSEFDRVVEFRRVIGSKNDSGVYQKSDDEYYKFRCKMIKSSTKLTDSNGIESTVYKQAIIMKNIKEMNDKMYCRIDGEDFDVTGIERDYRNRTMKVFIVSKDG